MGDWKRGLVRAGSRLAMLALALMAGMGLTPAPASADALDRITAARTLVVAVVPRAPWAMRDASGTWRGHDIDIAAALARDLGVTPRFVEVRIDTLPARLSGEADIGAGGLMIRSDLARSLVYSSPIGLSVVRTVATVGRATVPAFDKRTRIAVEQGSVAEAVARDSYPRATILALPDAHAATSALLHGGADALVASSPVPRLVASTFDAHAHLVGPPLARTAEALAMRPDDSRLHAYVNNWIAARVADGWLRHLRQHWFVDFGWVEDDARPAGARRGRTPQ